MTAEDFIAAVAAHVYGDGVRGELAQLERPAGRSPPAESVGLARWYAALGEEDRARVAQVVRRGVHAGVFELLAVLDGVLRVGPAGGRLELSYLAPDRARVLLNAPGAEDLHDLFQSQVYESAFRPPAA